MIVEDNYLKALYILFFLFTLAIGIMLGSLITILVQDTPEFYFHAVHCVSAKNESLIVRHICLEN